MATLKDVAKEAGLTVTTVSRVLNNRGYISEDAKKKVAAAMEKLNYHPNEMARSLHNKTSNMIGLIVPHIRHPYFSEMISNLENEAHKNGYNILLCNSHSISDRAKEYIDICSRNRVAGLVVFSGDVNVDQFISLDIPVITMERYLGHATASVTCDNHSGGQLAAKCLIDAGCKNLLHIASRSNVDTGMPANLRTDGFIAACRQASISYSVVTPEESYFLDISPADYLEDTLAKYPACDGIFLTNDIIAAQTIQICHKLGRKVPDDIKIIGFDDTNISTLTYPTISTIHQPIKEMCSTAIELLAKAIQGAEIPSEIVLPVSLIPRQSTMTNS